MERTRTEPDAPLLVVRVGAARCAVPERFVDRVLTAALPAPVPGGGEPCWLLRLETEAVPVCFVSTLFGAAEVRLRTSDQVVVLRRGAERLALWVDAIEDSVKFSPFPDAAPAPFIEGHHASAPLLPVLDVPSLFA